MTKNKRSLRALLREFASETSAHGIAKIQSAESLLWRLLWALGVMAGTGMVIYQGILLLETFMSKPVKSDIDVTYSRVSRAGLKGNHAMTAPLILSGATVAAIISPCVRSLIPSYP